MQDVSVTVLGQGGVAWLLNRIASRVIESRDGQSRVYGSRHAPGALWAIVDVVQAGRVEQNVVVGQVFKDGDVAYLEVREKVSCNRHRAGRDLIGGRGESAQENVIEIVRRGSCRMVVSEQMPGELRGACWRWGEGGNVGFVHATWTGVYVGRHG